MVKWHSWHLDVLNRGKVNGMKSASCHSDASRLQPQPNLTFLPILRTAVCFGAGYTHTQTHTNTTHKHGHILALLCLQFKQSVMGECVSLLFACSSLCAPSCLPLQNNRLAWENLSTGGLILSVCVHVFSPTKYCNSDCISFITLSKMH